MYLSVILSKFGSSWTKKFKEYFTVARKIMAANPDEEDLAIMAALIMLTADRHDFLSKEQRQVLYQDRPCVKALQLTQQFPPFCNACVR